MFHVYYDVDITSNYKSSSDNVTQRCFQETNFDEHQANP